MPNKTNGIKEAKRVCALEIQRSAANAGSRAAFETIPVYLNAIDARFNILDATLKASLLAKLGFDTKREIIGKKCYHVFKRADSPCPECTTASCMKSGRLETRLSTTEEDELIGFSTKVFSAPMRDDSNNIVGAVEFAVDITDQKQIEKTLFESVELYRQTFANISEAVFLTRNDGGFVFICPNVSVIFGYSVEQVADFKNISRLLKGFSFDADALESRGEIANIEAEVRIRSGRIRNLLVTIKKVDIKGGVLLYTCRDITDLKHKERKLIEYKNQLQSLISKLLLTEEREMRRISLELHENIGQCLALSKLKLATIPAKADESEVTRAKFELNELIGQIINDIRALAYEISPSELYNLGFEPAVEWLIESFRKRYGMKIDYISDGQDKPLGERVKYILFSSVRESLLNIVKHAKNFKASVSVGKDKENIRIVIKDYGVGFDIPRRAGIVNSDNRFGLFGIRERLEHINGGFKIESKPGGGCLIEMSAPLRIKQ